MTVTAVVQVFISVVLIVAALAKVADRRSFVRTIEGLGLSAPLAEFGSHAVIVSELLVAGCLVSERTRFWGTIGLIALLGLFTWSVARASSLDKRLACNCFGSLAPEEFGTRTFVRIAGMGAMALHLLLHRTPTGLELAPWSDIVASALLSLGVILIYGLGTTLYDGTRGKYGRSAGVG